MPLDDGIYQADVLSVNCGQSQNGNQQCRIRLRPVKIYLDGEDNPATDVMTDADDITAFMGFYNNKGQLNIGNVTQLRNTFDWFDGNPDSLDKISGIVIKVRVEADKEGNSWVRAISAANQALPVSTIPLTEKGKAEIKDKILQAFKDQTAPAKPKEDIPY